MKFFYSIATLVCAIILIDTMGQSQSYDQLAKTASWGPTSRGWQLGLVGGNAVFTAGKPIEIVAVVKNSGPSMGIQPLESLAFYSVLVDQHGRQVALRDGWRADELNTTGHAEEYVSTNGIVKSNLPIGERYQALAPGTYRLTALVNIIQGSMVDPVRNKPVFARLVSGTVAITVSPK